MYIKRRIFSAFERALESFPAVLLTGPRQAGKTTFLKHNFGHKYRYITFDDPIERQFAVDDPAGFLAQFDDDAGVILDEIQYAPEILPSVKMKIDNQREQMGRWILTGSQQFALMKNVGESLAGRVAILELYPFALFETEPENRGKLEHTVWHGLYPDPFLRPKVREQWVRGYLRTYIERDIRQLQNIRDLNAFERAVSLMAAHHGQQVNASALARDCGVSSPTVQSWWGLLEAGFVIFLLRPYFNNFGKRITKSSKLYFVDSSLVCHLTRQPDGAAALAGPMGGAFFEGLVISEVLKHFAAKGQDPDMYYWRSQSGLEVDLLLRLKGKLVPVEIKMTATPTKKHIEPLLNFSKLAQDEAIHPGPLVCRVDAPRDLPGGVTAMPLDAFSAWLDAR